MERKELKNYSSDHIRCVENNCENDDPCFWSTFYIQHEADAVMDAMEAENSELKECIKELEEENRKLRQSESWKMQQLRSELDRAEYLADEYGR